MLTFLLGVLGSLIAAELFDCCGVIAKLILRGAARLVPERLRDDLLEDWLANVEQTRGGLSKLCFALAIALWGTYRIRAIKPVVGNFWRRAKRAAPLIGSFAVGSCTTIATLYVLSIIRRDNRSWSSTRKAMTINSRQIDRQRLGYCQRPRRHQTPSTRVFRPVPTRKSIWSPIGTISPRNLNAARTVNSLSAATDVGVRVVAARVQENATR
jgi:hypothetical protein